MPPIINLKLLSAILKAEPLLPVLARGGEGFAGLLNAK
jgi:hypothetical protein